MNKFEKSLLVLLIILLGCVVYYIAWGQNGNELTEDQLVSRIFKCPEQYFTDEEKFESYKQFGAYYLSKNPTSTMEDILDKRYDFLVENNCTETLQVWSENEIEKEEYWAEIEREEVVRSVMGSTTNNIIRQ